MGDATSDNWADSLTVSREELLALLPEPQVLAVYLGAQLAQRMHRRMPTPAEVGAVLGKSPAAAAQWLRTLDYRNMIIPCDRHFGPRWSYYQFNPVGEWQADPRQLPRSRP